MDAAKKPYVKPEIVTHTIAFGHYGDGGIRPMPPLPRELVCHGGIAEPVGRA